MKQIIDIPVESISPDADAVFQAQGIPAGAQPSERVKDLYDSAEKLFEKLAAPAGIMADIAIEEFKNVYPGIGKNDPDTPLEHIFPEASHMALFAATMGPAVSHKIEELMKSKGNDFALGYMLDAVASYCADKTSTVAESIFLDRVSAGPPGEPLKALLYSPGYCGWHVSGQGKLFEFLKPEEIGIALNPSYLMIPLKSVSGLLVAGPPEIHHFDNIFSCCDLCHTRTCQERMAV
jgi:hypothetical protein